ncbi:MAG: PTS sugar transporter subunit IIA [Opitutaceae bacterium]|nr:PTS sugar transporter subunit IIA [Opitutaceae bacterium]
MSVPMPTSRAVCSLVVPSLVAASPATAIEQLAAGFGQFPGLPGARTIAAAALEREAQASTFLGHATALPHARIIGLSHLTVAFGRAARPIPWTRDSDPVQLIFLGVVPADQPRHYLEFMRALAKALTDPQIAGGLLSAPDEPAIRAWLRLHLQLQ